MSEKFEKEIFTELDIALQNVQTLKKSLQVLQGSLTTVEIRIQNILKSVVSASGVVDSSIQVYSSVNDLKISPRAWNILKSREISTVGELIKLSKADLLKMPNCGRASVREIEIVLISHGFKLRGE